MIFLLALTTDLSAEFAHVKRQLREQFDLTSAGPLMFVDFEGTAKELTTNISLVAPNNASFFVAALSDWDSKNTQHADQWLGEKRAALS
jgi:hypothetical protein